MSQLRAEVARLKREKEEVGVRAENSVSTGRSVFGSTKSRIQKKKRPQAGFLKHQTWHHCPWFIMLLPPDLWLQTPNHLQRPLQIYENLAVCFCKV